jgi:hypothetical protein
MSYHPSQTDVHNGTSGGHIPSGIVYFGHNRSDQVYEANAGFTIDGTYLNASKVRLSDSGGTIGSMTTPGAITIAANGDVSLVGDLTIAGTTTTVSTSNLTVENPLIFLASGNSANINDIGFYGVYNDGVNDEYAGLFRDATDSKFRLFHSLEDEPTTTINTAGTGYTKGILVADLEGNADTATTLENGRYIGVSDQLTGSGYFDGSQDVVFDAQLTADAINDQTEASVLNASDYFLIANGASLRKLSASNLGSMSNFIIRDEDGSEVQVDDGEYIQFSGGAGIYIDLTDTDGGTTADPYDLTINLKIDELSTANIATDDSFLILDSDGSTHQRSTVNNLGSYLAGTNLTANADGVIGIADSVIEGIVFTDANFDDSDTLDFTVTTGEKVTAVVKNSSITEEKRSRTVETVDSASVTSKTAEKDITLVDATSASVTISLPEITGLNPHTGRVMIVKRKDSASNDVVITRSGTSNTIDGSTHWQLYYKNETLTFVSDGSNWYII